MNRADLIAPILGALLGLAVSGYVLVYLPMNANYERNGCVWLECRALEAGARDE